MSRKITGHEINEVNAKLMIIADEPSHGGASHVYTIGWEKKDGETGRASLPFQIGPVKEVGVNGVTHEALLAIILDRLYSFQEGEYRCRENAMAITKIEESLHWLERRTRLRDERGVEGTSAK